MGPLAIAGISTGVNALSNIFTAKANDKRSIKFWNMQNDYNHPSAQMARLQEAGLNPNLIYGSGSSNTGNAGTLQQPTREPIKTDNPMQAMLIHQQIEQSKAQTDNFRTQNTVLLEDAELKRTQSALNVASQAGQILRNDTTGLDNIRTRELFTNSLDHARVLLRQDQQKLRGLTSEANYKDATADLRVQKLGAETNNIIAQQGGIQAKSAIELIKLGIWKNEKRNPNHQLNMENLIAQYTEKYGTKAVEAIKDFGRAIQSEGGYDALIKATQYSGMNNKLLSRFLKLFKNKN